MIFAEAARVQFEALTKRHKTQVGGALLLIAQKASRHGVWQADAPQRLSISYEVHPGAVVVTEISTRAPRPPKPEQPYQGMDMRHESDGRWIHLNAHEE